MEMKDVRRCKTMERKDVWRRCKTMEMKDVWRRCEIKHSCPQKIDP
jgi:hypothetical protein